MIAALPAEASDVPEALGEGALVLYAAVLAGSGGREEALPLLAADALLTHAFAAKAEQDPEGIADLARRWSGEGRLGKVGDGLPSQALTPVARAPRSAPPRPHAGEGAAG